MSLRVFHDDAAAASIGAELVLTSEEAHYLLKVRRAAVGTKLEVLDGHGGRWQATLKQAGGGHATVELDAVVNVPAANCEVTVLLALPDPKALLDALAAACAGGAHCVLLTTTARSQRSVPGRDRIERVLRATLRQCGRPAPPAVSGPVELDEALAHLPEQPGVVAHPKPRSTALVEASARRLLIGPEGGFDAGEFERIERAAFVPLSLGPWTLRTEAAVAAALGRLMG
jgi:16S rRNA (uracil1498-N3)-methyltransferase